MSIEEELPIRWPHKLARSRLLVTAIITLALSTIVFLASGVESFSGQHARTIKVVDSVDYYANDELEDALQTVKWGQTRDVVVYIGGIPDAEWALPTDERCHPGISCLKTVAPEYFSIISAPRESVFLLWIDPDNIEVHVGIRWTLQRNSQMQNDTEEAIKAALVMGHVPATDMAEYVQRLAAAEVGMFQLENEQRIIFTALAALLIAFLTAVAHAAYWRDRDNQILRSPLLRLSRAQRHDTLERARRIYTECTDRLDTVELEIAAVPQTEYTPVLSSRLEAWKDLYLECAREQFDASMLSDSQLTSKAEADRLYRLIRLAELVEAGQESLMNDARALADPSRAREYLEPTWDMLRRSLEATLTLDQSITASTPQLDQTIDAWQRKLRDQPKPNHVTGVIYQLTKFDALAHDMSQQADRAFVLYEKQEGHEFSGRHLIEDPARVRALSHATTLDNPLHADTTRPAKPTVTQASVTKQQSQNRRRRLKVAFSPRNLIVAIAVAATAGLIATAQEVGTFYTPTNAPGYLVAAPNKLGDPAQPSTHALGELSGTDDDSLHQPRSVIIRDDANIIRGTQALDEQLRTLRLTSPVDIVVFTADSEDLANRPAVEISSSAKERLAQFDKTTTRLLVAPPESIVVWIVSDHTGFSIGEGVVNTSAATLGSIEWEAQDQLNRLLSIGEVEAGIWNAFVIATHDLRGDSIEQTHRLTTVWKALKQGGTVAVGVFVTILVFLPFLTALVRRARQRHERESRSQRISSALTVGIDALELELNLLKHQFPAYGQQLDLRWQNWQRYYVAALEADREDNSRDHESSVSRLALTQLLRAQVKSLWRTSTILEQKPGWASAWDQEVSLLYACDSTGSRTAALTRLTRDISSGTIAPADALIELDTLSAGDQLSARLRCLSDDVEHLGAHANALESHQIYALDRQAETVTIPRGKEHKLELRMGAKVKRFFRRLDRALDTFRYRMLITAVAILVVIPTFLLLQPRIYEAKRVQLDLPPVPSPQVVVDDPEGLFDAEAVSQVAGSAKLGPHQKLLIISAPQSDSPYDPPTIDDPVRYRDFFYPPSTRTPQLTMRESTIVVVVGESRIDVQTGRRLHVPRRSNDYFESNWAEDRTALLTQQDRTAAVRQWLTHMDPIARYEFSLRRGDREGIPITYER
ncbi:MAG: hypothetical protein Q4P71_06670 [Actinomycetaceae bacterium]|nr:hypothetical protein [Actinomycetaceae bacterium]